MDEFVGDNSRAPKGNTAVPDWMQQRRLRQQSQANQPEKSSAGRSAAGATTAAGTAELDRPLESPAPAVELKPMSSAPKAQVTSQEAAGPFVGLPGLDIPTTPPVPPPPVIQPPAVQPRNVRAKGPKPKLVEVKPDQPVSKDWFEAFREEYLSREALKGYGLSLATHLVIAIVLSVAVFHREIRGAGVSTMLIGGGGDEGGQGGEGLDDSNVLEVEAAGPSQADLDAVMPANVLSDALAQAPLIAPDSVRGVLADGPGSGKGKGDGDGDGEGNGKGDGIGDGLGVGGFKMPEGGKVVKKGSFTAWTVPEDPAPGEDYKIIIQIKYKDRKQKLTVRDITGSVTGTDMFRLAISRHTAEFLPDANQVVVNIPGAAARVHDTIRIYSTVLRENQRLDIDF